MYVHNIHLGWNHYPFIRLLHYWLVSTSTGLYLVYHNQWLTAKRVSLICYPFLIIIIMHWFTYKKSDWWSPTKYHQHHNRHHHHYHQIDSTFKVNWKLISEVFFLCGLYLFVFPNSKYFTIVFFFISSTTTFHDCSIADDFLYDIILFWHPVCVYLL